MSLFIIVSLIIINNKGDNFKIIGIKNESGKIKFFRFFI